jgi:HAD superfamily hydrolase (TIGR01549 family)
VQIPKLVIFDVDGTLYKHHRVKKIMMVRLLLYFLLHPWCVKELKIIATFRRCRELLAAGEEQNINEEQYLKTAHHLHITPERVKEVVERWIYNEPLQYLNNLLYPGVREFLSFLSEKGVFVAVFSDYPAKAKVESLGLHIKHVFSSVDPDIDQLKPWPTGLSVIAKKFNLLPCECLMIGDRNDKDGECARRAEMPYLIFSPKEKSLNSEEKKFSSYYDLIKEFSNCK